MEFYNDIKESDILVGARYFSGKKNLKLREKGKKLNTMMFFNKKTGELINEFTTFKESEAKGIKAKEVAPVAHYVENEEVIVVNKIKGNKDKGYSYSNEKVIGYARTEYDIKTGKSLNKSFFTWDQLEEYIPINKYGYLNGKGERSGFLYMRESILTQNGNLLFIFEQYKGIGGVGKMTGVRIDDMFIVEVDSDMKVVGYKRIDKAANNKRNSDGITGLAAAIAFDEWDYLGNQKLDNNKYLFFYFNRQRPEDGGKKQNVLGIITYDNGIYKEEKLQLKTTEGSELFIRPAKNGYIMIVEKFKDKSTEVRLEKVN